MQVQISSGALAGTVTAIPSKSHAHRLLICAALSDTGARLKLSSLSEDVEATLACLRALGAVVTGEDGALNVQPIDCGHVPSKPLLDCGESGSTLRFLLPAAAALCREASFLGRGRLPQRPNGPLIAAMEAHGSRFSSETLPFTVSRMTSGGVFAIPGNVSSQYATGLLLAGPLLREGAEIRFTTPVESRGYLDMTVDTLKTFGVTVTELPDGYGMEPGSRLRSPGNLQVERDWSDAAFWLVAGALGGGITVAGLDRASLQGDRICAEKLKEMGASVRWTDDKLFVRSAGRLRAISVDASDVPDLVPILAVAAASAEGTTRFYRAGRLRWKESDRLKSTAAMLNALGGKAEVRGDELLVTGSEQLSGGTVDSANDHRIAMSAAVASVLCRAPVRILGAEAASKSHPSFFDDFRTLGGVVDVLDLR